MPADVVLACGIFGNVSTEDIHRFVAFAPALCAPGATVIWTRHRRPPDRTDDIRHWFAAAGFDELAFAAAGSRRHRGRRRAPSGGRAPAVRGRPIDCSPSSATDAPADRCPPTLRSRPLLRRSRTDRRSARRDSTDGAPASRRSRSCRSSSPPYAYATAFAGYTASSDNATNELTVRDVGSRMVLLGPFSRHSWSHPGPAFVYVMAIPYRILGSDSTAMLLGTLLVNAVAVATIVVLARRWGGRELAAATAARDGAAHRDPPERLPHRPVEPLRHRAAVRRLPRARLVLHVRRPLGPARGVRGGHLLRPDPHRVRGPGARRARVDGLALRPRPVTSRGSVARARVDSGCWESPPSCCS